jgi:hypothetical protein
MSLFGHVYVASLNKLCSDYIDSLPLANTPEVFGLHPNAEIGYYTNAAKEMWSHLIELQPQTGQYLKLSVFSETMEQLCMPCLLLAKLEKRSSTVYQCLWL